jgi:hypothetical protein
MPKIRNNNIKRSKTSITTRNIFNNVSIRRNKRNRSIKRNNFLGSGIQKDIIEELLHSGLSRDEIVKKLIELKEKNVSPKTYTILELRKHGFNSKQILDLGYNFEEIKHLYNIPQLIYDGVSLKQLLKKFTLKELKEHVKIKDLVELDFGLEIKNIPNEIEKNKNIVLTYQDNEANIKKNYTWKELISSGISFLKFNALFWDLIDKNKITAKDIAAHFSLNEIKTLKYSLEKAAKYYSKDEIMKYFKLKTLAEFYDIEILSKYFTAHELSKVYSIPIMTDYYSKQELSGIYPESKLIQYYQPRGL